MFPRGFKDMIKDTGKQADEEINGMRSGRVPGTRSFQRSSAVEGDKHGGKLTRDEFVTVIFVVKLAEPWCPYSWSNTRLHVTVEVTVLFCFVFG